MKSWKTYLKKAGGKKLLMQYFRTGTLPIAINQFITLGKDKKALELLRLGIEFKFYTKLRHKYMHYALKTKEIIESTYNSSSSIPSKKMWLCWWQGIDDAPDLVKRCYRSVKQNFRDWDIVVITINNYSEYVSFPDFIVAKWKQGIISNTHMSDLLRIELLIRYGGMWLDATILSTSGELPSSIYQADLFFYQCLKPGADGHTILCSSWLMRAKAYNKILLLTRELLYKYWISKNRMDDYFILHYFLTMACEIYPDEYEKIPQFDNAIPHILLLNLFKRFDSTYWYDLCHATCFHKLSYKLDQRKVKTTQNTYYNYIMGDRNDIS